MYFWKGDIKIMRGKYEIHRLTGKAPSAILLIVSAVVTVIVAGQLVAGSGVTAETEQEWILPPVNNGNNALFFDGVNDYLEIPEIAAIRTRKEEPLTVEFWAFVSAHPNPWQKVLSKWGARGGDDDEFVFCFHPDGRAGFANTGSTGLSTRTQIPTNIWFHLCCVWDGANVYYKLYLNGEFIPQELDGGAPLRLTGEPIRIGTDGHRNQCFRGMIDEVRIWNIARAQGDIQTTMNRKLVGDEPGLVGYWDFDEGQGQVIFDFSGSGNRGRLGRLPFPDDADPRWVASGVELTNP
jgi:hypothetical protein